jgi:hypothetical protein
MTGRIALPIAAALVLAAPAAGAVAGPTKVIKTPAVETRPSATTDWLVWTAETLGKSNTGVVWARPTGGTKFRVNPKGTVGFTSINAIDGTTLVYSQRSKQSNNADIKFFDLVTKTRTDAPSDVNTSRYEALPGISGDWLIFARSESRSSFAHTVWLFNMDTLEMRKLVQGTNSVYVQQAGIAGNYAGYTRCTSLRHCQNWRYDIAAETATKIPNPKSRAQYGGSLMDDGTMYFAESRSIDCGSNFAFWRYPLGGPRKKLLALPTGQDTTITAPVEHSNGNVTVFFDKWTCKTGQADIFKFVIKP